MLQQGYLTAICKWHVKINATVNQKLRDEKYYWQIWTALPVTGLSYHSHMMDYVEGENKLTYLQNRKHASTHTHKTVTVISSIISIK